MTYPLPYHDAQPQSLTERKLARILDPDHPLCRDEVVWVLEFIKKKVAEEDPKWMELSQPRLLKNFHYFAEIALMLIQKRNGFDQEAGRLKDWLNEAVHGLQPAAAGRFRQTSE